MHLSRFVASFRLLPTSLVVRVEKSTRRMCPCVCLCPDNRCRTNQVTSDLDISPFGVLFDVDIALNSELTFIGRGKDYFKRCEIVVLMTFYARLDFS